MFKWLKYPTVISLATLIISGIIVFLLSALEKPTATYQDKILAKKDVKVFARVGKRNINRLAGFTSPYAEVQLFSTNLSRKTLADEAGAFLFTDIPIVDNQGEFCLISQDINLLPSYPTCIAPPTADMDVDVIQVLLSPSIMVESPVITAGDTVTASGMTFPDSPVNVYLYSENETWLSYFNLWLSTNQNSKYWQPLRIFIHPLISTTYQLDVLLQKVSYYLDPVKTAAAFGLPKYATKSNENGHFEFSLPGSKSSYNRFFVAAAMDVRKDKQPVKLTSEDTAVNENLPGQPGLPIEVSVPLIKDNEPDFLPKTSVTSQAVDNQAEINAATYLRDSPKSNTLYFRSLGWLGNGVKLFTSWIKQFTATILNPLALILLEMIIVLVLGIVIAWKHFSDKEPKLYCNNRCDLPPRHYQSKTTEET